MAVLATQTWLDEFRAGLVDRHGPPAAKRLFARYADGFSAGFTEDHQPGLAVACVAALEDYLEQTSPLLRLIRARATESGEPDDDARLVLVWASPAPALLADVFPVLENFGLRIAAHRSFDVRPLDARAMALEEFRLVPRDVALLSDPAVAALAAAAFTAVWEGAADDDGFNQLVLKARLSWREVGVLRAAYAYLRQAGTTFGQAYAQRTLVAHPRVAQLLVALFHARFTPGMAAAAAETAREAVERALDEVDTLSEDRMLRALLDVLTSVVRTNYYQRDPDGDPKPWLVLKLAPERLVLLPQPRPAVETFVYSPRVEGLHLRVARVARGGIRWSDRPEDFRTEVLGLMKAQRVKNAVIVPHGAKGAFVVKRPPSQADAAELGAEVRACYAMFIRGLLDVTDNRVAGDVVSPPDVVCHDGADSYLVVAADKGTATFSDLANSIAAEYGFWLSDAFASGGATGYDHKALGITARGVWESVRRHSGELGIDPARDEFTVAGIGDMAGDVFGNGMLASDRIRLVAAFDHRHIFLDPDPDPATSYAERRRLFELPRSSWDDYDATVISPGGGVFRRSAKSVPLSPQVRTALGVTADQLPADELIKAILRAPVDLLFNGGIGTYIKAADELHVQVGDRANDGVRIDAAQLRARVVAEGGNLGLTQPARIEYALAGGRVNTDFIDNSAGVDTSDREVNIKILLDAAVAAGRLNRQQRDRLLADVADEVAALVLAGNYAQAQAISVTETLGGLTLDRHTQVMRQVEAEGLLDRELEFLPDDETLAQRQAAGLGLTRPEIAVVLAVSKNEVKRRLLDSDVPDDPSSAASVAGYLPPRLRDEFAEEIGTHPLRREIATTALVNELFNHMGSGLLLRLMQLTGEPERRAVFGYVAARDLLGLPELWAAIDRLDVATHADVQVRALIEIRRVVEQVGLWLLRHRGRVYPADEIRRLRPGVELLGRRLPVLLQHGQYDELERRITELVDAGAPADLAESVALLRVQAISLDVVELAGSAGRDLEWLAAVYFALGEWLDLRWLRGQTAELATDDHWSILGKASLRGELATVQRRLTMAVMAGAEHSVAPEQATHEWLRRNADRLALHRQTIDELRAAPAVDVPMVAVALEGLRNLVRTGADEV
ncbi:NAD-glutamate dehydrogenase domain-containing protein [Haloechinothrix halophila]|uniref:NAD-glutamate dehydrogenase domain-containing protein n=1 Tax=Haloechinothrix halophila TaxID=1069073 RepID=UPI00040858A8|nr:NAD-glutamate dehydrogenase domain-containing protein [Haloechinothrix halophila]